MKPLRHVPFVDLAAQYQSIEKQMNDSIGSALHNFDFVRGKEVSAFEHEFANLLGAQHCINTGNGTDALFIALKTLGIKPGDEVITPAFSWISSAETISLCGAKPVFADVDLKTYTIDPLLIEEKINSKTKAIVAVHLYGQAAPIKSIQEICRRHQLYLIEDCAQAHLTKENDKHVGTSGDAGAFSFYPTKNLGAYGDAGCILTSNPVLAKKMRQFANHGALHKDDHMMEGVNSRMDSLQAAVLLAKLRHLNQWNQKRIENARLYHSLLLDVSEIMLPEARPNTVHTFHLYVIRARKRDELKAFLLENGIQSIIHYPSALPNLPAYQYLGTQKGDYRKATLLQQEVLSLPIYPELQADEIQYVSEKIKEFYKI